MQRGRGGRSELSCKNVASDQQDDRPCHQHKPTCKPMRCPSRQEAAPGGVIRVRDACHTRKTAGDRLSFQRLRVLGLVVVLVPFDEEDESQFVGLLLVEAA